MRGYADIVAADYLELAVKLYQTIHLAGHFLTRQREIRDGGRLECVSGKL